MHFRRAGTLDGTQWRLHKKNEVIVYLLCSINYEIKIFKVFT